MKLIVGLGNPGSEYACSRHNVGFMAVDELAHRHSFSEFKEKFKGLIAAGEIAGEKIYLLKPQTYMNLSGESVLAVCSFYKIKPQDIIVFHDDMDLDIARVKVKTDGGSGGHNGIKSIDAHIGVNYTRVRIGISKPERKEQVVDWVLSRFKTDELEKLSALFQKMSDSMDVLLTKGNENFMNKIKTN